MLTDNDLKTAKKYFGIFANPPEITLNTTDCDSGQSLLMIEGNGLSICKYQAEAPNLRFQKDMYVVHDHDGEQIGLTQSSLLEALKIAVEVYTKELFRRTTAS